jgi:hypothetical protein
MPESHKGLDSQGVTDSSNDNYVNHLAFCLQKHPKLAALIERWDTLPESVRKQIIELAGRSGHSNP